MDWPSKNVPSGGFMQHAKTSYNPETAQFLKVLLNESKMAMMQKKSDYILRNGEPLPSLCKNSVPESRFPVLIRPGSSKKRSLDTIANSGVYEREQFKPQHPIIDREKEKEKLQNKMAFNCDVKIQKNKVLEKRVNQEVREDINRFDQLVSEIKEREQWLQDMERLGEGAKYRQIIQQQIQEKVREMNSMKSCNHSIFDK